MSDQNKQKPIAFRDGGVFAKIWIQESKKGPYPTIEIGRTYQKADGSWGTSTSFARNDFLKLQALLPDVNREVAKIQELIREQQKSQSQALQDEIAAGRSAEPQDGLAGHLEEVLANAAPGEKSNGQAHSQGHNQGR